MGLQLFSLDSKSFEAGYQQRSKVSKKHKMSLFFFVLLLLLQVSGIVFAIKMEKEKQPDENVTTALVVQIMAYIGMVTSMFTTVINGFVKTEKLKEIFCNIEKVLKVFAAELNINVNFASFSQSFKLTLIKTTLTFVISSLLVLGFIYYYNQSNVFVWALLCIFPYFYTQIIFCYFTFFVLLVQESLKSVKIVLQKLQRTHEITKTSVKVISFRTKPLNKNNEMLHAVNKLKKIYSILCDTTELVNDVFGLPIFTQLVIIIMGNISAGNKVKLLINAVVK